MKLPSVLSFSLLDEITGAEYLSSETVNDCWSALLLILPGIDAIPGLTLQNRSQTEINESVMGSEPVTASKVTAQTWGCVI